MPDIQAPATPTVPAPSTQTPTPEAAKPMRPRDIARSPDTAKALKERLAARKAEEDAEFGEEGDTPEPATSSKAKSDPKPAAKVEKLEAKIEAAGGDAPDQKAGETDKQYELRLSKTLGELQAAKKEIAKLKKDGETTSAEFARMKKLLDSGKTDPLRVLEELGLDFEKLTRGINEDRYKAPEKRLELPPELQAKIDRLEKADKEREANELQAKAERQRIDDTAVVTRFIEANAEDYPLVSSMKWAASQVINDAYAQGVTDVAPILNDLEAALGKNLESLMGSDKSLKALLKKNPELKKSIMASLELETSAPRAKAPEGPSTLGDIDADVPARSAKESKDERIARIKAEFKAKRAKEAEEDDEG